MTTTIALSIIAITSDRDPPFLLGSPIIARGTVKHDITWSSVSPCHYRTCADFLREGRLLQIPQENDTAATATTTKRAPRRRFIPGTQATLPFLRKASSL
jgi:hypothetical protein